MFDINILYYVYFNKNDVLYVDMNILIVYIGVKKMYVIIIIVCIGGMMLDFVVVEVNFFILKN